jgi:hypothetical protein
MRYADCMEHSTHHMMGHYANDFVPNAYASLFQRCYSTMSTILLAILPPLLLCLPPLLIPPLSFGDYRDSQELSLLFLGGWLLFHEGGILLEKRLFPEKQRSFWHVLLMISVTLLAMILATVWDFIPEEHQQNFSLTMLCMLPLAFTGNTPSPLLIRVITYGGVLGIAVFLRISAVLVGTTAPSLWLSCGYGILAGSMAAQIPFLRAIHLGEKLPPLSYQIHRLLWGLPEFILLLTVGFGFLPPLFLGFLLSLLPLMWLMARLPSFENGDTSLAPLYALVGGFTLLGELLLLAICSAT